MTVLQTRDYCSLFAYVALETDATVSRSRSHEETQVKKPPKGLSTISKTHLFLQEHKKMAKARHRYKKLYGHFFYWFKTLIGSSKSTLFHENASFPWHIFQINYIILLHQDLSHCFSHTSQFVTACKTMLKYFYHYPYFFLLSFNSLFIASNRAVEISPK